MPTYLTQCACFACRKSFKRLLANSSFVPVCPQCSLPTYVMGRYFRAPANRSVQQWRKVEMLYSAGVRFSGSQSWRLGQFPDTIAEAREFIARNRVTLIAEQFRREQWQVAATAERAYKAIKRREQTLKRKAQQAKLAALAVAGDVYPDA